MNMKERSDHVRREVEHAKLHNLPNLLVDLELLDELFRGNVPEPPDCAFFSPEDPRWGKP